MVIATSRELDILDNLDVFHHIVPYPVPEEQERFKLLDLIFHQRQLLDKVSLSSISKQTSGMVAQDLVNLFNLSVKNALDRSSKTEYFSITYN